MMPTASDFPLALEEAKEAIASSPGFVPVAIDHRGQGRIYWADLGTRPFREWQYLYTVKNAVEEQRMAVFHTGMEILDDDDLFNDSAPVRGLIFHISRCGSTLFGKCLASCPEFLVINQGGPLQRGFWAWATNDFRDSLPSDEICLNRFRRLVAAMARPRNLGYQAAFVKFISWNTRYLDFIRSAFPGTPSLFMYRDPVEVIASVFRETTAALLAKDTAQGAFLADLSSEEIARQSDTQYLADCYAGYFRAALGAEGLPLLNYSDLRPHHLRPILAVSLGLEVSEAKLALMKHEFSVHSKDDTKQSRFMDDTARKQASLSDSQTSDIRRRLKELYQQAESSRSNMRYALIQPDIS